MGLDISAFKKATFVRPLNLGEESDAEWPRLKFLYVNPDFPARADGMVDGLYDVGGDTRFGTEEERDGSHQLHFRAGSYSGYSYWRDCLARVALEMAPEDVWNDPQKSVPFRELINFSDCEGIIGPKTCARLAASFEVHGPSIKLRADKILGDEAEWFVALFETWGKAFKLAADTGCVQFH